MSEVRVKIERVSGEVVAEAVFFPVVPRVGERISFRNADYLIEGVTYVFSWHDSDAREHQLATQTVLLRVSRL